MGSKVGSIVGAGEDEGLGVGERVVVAVGEGVGLGVGVGVWAAESTVKVTVWEKPAHKFCAKDM